MGGLRGRCAAYCSGGIFDKAMNVIVAPSALPVAQTLRARATRA
jgi:hypothetical protein